MRAAGVAARSEERGVKPVIFTLASARSGTLYLRSLFRRNTRDCDCRHETFFDWGNPTMLGPSIYDACAGRLDQLRARLAQKREHARAPFMTPLAHRQFFPQELEALLHYNGLAVESVAG